MVAQSGQSLTSVTFSFGRMGLYHLVPRRKLDSTNGPAVRVLLDVVIKAIQMGILEMRNHARKGDLSPGKCMEMGYLKMRR
jgi:hypothetical protein